MAPKQRSAAKEILLALDADPALIEHYDPNEIEAIPLAAIQTRLVELGLMPTMPVKLRRILLDSTPSPAADVLRVLADDFECLQPQDIEAYPLGEVTACLQRGGINYRAGVAAIIDFVGERAADSVDLGKDRAKLGSIKSATSRSRKSLFLVTIGLAAAATAAAAATVGFFVTREARQDAVITDQRYEIQGLSVQVQGLKARLQELRTGADDLISLAMLVPPSNPMEHRTWPPQSDDSNAPAMSVGGASQAQLRDGSGNRLDDLLCVDNGVAPETALASGSAHRVATAADLALCHTIIGGITPETPLGGSGNREARTAVTLLDNVQKSRPSGSAVPGPGAGAEVAPEAPLGGGRGNRHFDGTRGTPAAGSRPVAESLGVSAFNAIQTGARALRAGDTKAALDALEYAARNGEVTALWKLGRMYADGDGVKQDDRRAFDYFRTLADSHSDETPGTGPAVFIAKAFVAVGSYYLTGIPNSDVKPDAVHAREMFWYAASYFGDPDAQYRLGRMYLDGQGAAKDPKQAMRWLFTAASKGQYEAQAVLGAMLFRGQWVPRDPSRGLMWLMLARDAATPKETWITDLYTAALKQASETERSVALVHLQQWIEQSHSGHLGDAK